MMFRLIGGVVVYGFALYGAVQLIERSRMDRLSKVGIGKQGDGNAGELTMDTAAGLETGELAAVNSRSVVINRYGRQWYQMKIVGLLNHGEIVKKGDSIAQLDPADINKYILESESNLETQLAVLEKLYVEQENKKQGQTITQLQNELKMVNNSLKNNNFLEQLIQQNLEQEKTKQHIFER